MFATNADIGLRWCNDVPLGRC